MTDIALNTPPANFQSHNWLETRKRGNELERFFYEMRRRPTMLVGFIIFLILVLASVFAPFVTPYDPIKIQRDKILAAPSVEHPFGTDRFGRDLLSRILYGGRISLRIGLISVGIAVAIGVPTGLVAGFFGGITDDLISRITDVFLAFPGFLLALTIAFVLGPDIRNVMIAVGISNFPTYVRLARGSALAVRETVYVEAARSVGCSNWRIIWRYILPNVISPIIIISTLGLAGAILSAAGLSFLGMGAQPPIPEWGTMLNEGRQVMRSAWWGTTFPGLAILLAVLSVNLIGDGLRDFLDPRLK